MTEKSYFWDHATGGDSFYSPYDADEFNTFHFFPAVGDAFDTAYIVPGYLNDLDVLSAGGSQHAVAVRSGAAFINNFLYVNDADTTVSLRRAASGYFRWDTIVLRLDRTTARPTIRIGVVEGVEQTTYTATVLPSLTQTTAIYEVKLADVFVNGVSTYITAASINDGRRFAKTAYSTAAFSISPQNLLRNSEWLAFSYSGTANKAPDMWLSTTTSGSYFTGRPYGSGRGNRAVLVDTSPNNSFLTQYIKAGKSKTFTFSAPVDVTAAGSFAVYLYGIRKNGTFSTVSKSFQVLDQYFTGYVQMTVTFPEDDIDIIQVFVTAINGDVQLSQPILVAGYHPGQCRAISEVVMFRYNTPDASWAATAKSTGTTTIDLASSFNSIIKNYTKAVVLRIRGRDSASAAAANCYMNILGYAAPFNGIYGSLHLEGVTNDNWREMQVIVPVDQIYWGTGTTGAQFRIQIQATGAGTFDATVQLAGIII